MKALLPMLNAVFDQCFAVVSVFLNATEARRESIILAMAISSCPKPAGYVRSRMTVTDAVSLALRLPLAIDYLANPWQTEKLLLQDL